MAPQNAFAKDTISVKDPQLDKLWKGPRVRDEYQAREESLSHPGTNCEGDPGLTDQSQSAETDVNMIFARALRTGGILPGADTEGVYGDFSSVEDFQQAQNIISRGMNQFSLLNAEVRKRFNNDPAQFLEFATDESNIPAMVKMGLLDESALPPPPAAPDSPGGQPGPKKDVAAPAKQPEQ
jgi:hypothetical protein